MYSRDLNLFVKVQFHKLRNCSSSEAENTTTTTTMTTTTTTMITTLAMETTMDLDTKNTQILIWSHSEKMTNLSELGLDVRVT